MRTFYNLAEALQAVRDFTIDRPEGCPPDIFAMLRHQANNLRDWDDTLQAIYYAPRGIGDEETVGPQLMQIAAGALAVFQLNTWHQIGESGDAGRMANALRRDAGEPAEPGFSWPDPADDPVRIVVPEPPAPTD